MNLDEKEKQRINILKKYEYLAYEDGHKYIAGIDEAGRGPIAGPVTAAAVILPPDFFIAGVDDSKRLSAVKRTELAQEIKKGAISWAVAHISSGYIEKMNILHATKKAMVLAVRALAKSPDMLFIDALKLTELNIEQRPMVKGDQLSFSIACASIIAKVERDRMMESFDLLYPGYSLAKNKGYATKEHLAALTKYGPAGIHRANFEPVKSILAVSAKVKQPSLFDVDA